GGPGGVALQPGRDTGRPPHLVALGPGTPPGGHGRRRPHDLPGQAGVVPLGGADGRHAGAEGPAAAVPAGPGELIGERLAAGGPLAGQPVELHAVVEQHRRAVPGVGGPGTARRCCSTTACSSTGWPASGPPAARRSPISSPGPAGTAAAGPSAPAWRPSAPPSGTTPAWPGRSWGRRRPWPP